MKLYLKGHDYKYAVEQMLLTMFPAERPEYPETETDGDCMTVSLEAAGDSTSAECVLRRGREVFTANESRENAAMPIEVTKLMKAICSDWMPSPPTISLLFTVYAPLTVMIGMKSKTRKMMPRGLGTQL